MSPTEIIFSPSAEREIKKLTRDRQKDVFGALRKMKDSSGLVEIEKIRGHPNFYRIKAGRNMRIIYHPLTGSRLVILVIRDRKAAYRGLNTLDEKLETALLHIEAEATMAVMTHGA